MASLAWEGICVWFNSNVAGMNKKRDCPAVYNMLDTAVIGSFSTKGMMALLVSHNSADSIKKCVRTNPNFSPPDSYNTLPMYTFALSYNLA